MKVSIVNLVKPKSNQQIRQSLMQGLQQDERYLLDKALEMNKVFASDANVEEHNSRELLKKVRRYGVVKGILKFRVGLTINPEIKAVMNDTNMLKNTLIKYFSNI